MNLTAKQLELLRVIDNGNGKGDPTDLDEILAGVRYETTKQSLQFSIRALIKHALIEKLGVEKRRGRVRQIIACTPLGHDYNLYGRTAPASPAYICEKGDELDAAILDV